MAQGVSQIFELKDPGTYPIRAGPLLGRRVTERARGVAMSCLSTIPWINCALWRRDVACARWRWSPGVPTWVSPYLNMCYLDEMGSRRWAALDAQPFDVAPTCQGTAQPACAGSVMAQLP